MSGARGTRAEVDDPSRDQSSRLPRSLGTWIAALRRTHKKPAGRRGVAAERPWARVDLARRAGISEVTLYHIETDAELPRFEVLIAITGALELPKWESQMLRDMWMARAARIVEAPTVSDAERAAMIRLLGSVPYPAVILDQLYFVKAANKYHLARSGHYMSGTVLPVERTPRGLLGPRALSQLENVSAVVGPSLRRFLIHTAPWSMLPDYPAVLEAQDVRLEGVPDWWQRIHAGEGIEDAAALADAPAFLMVSLSLDVGRSHVMRTFVPQALGDYEKWKARVDRQQAQEYLAPDWK